MSPQARIIMNSLATYARSLVALALGLFSTRWVLKALGQDDLGLYGVIGGMIVFITYINATLAISVSRFYAYSIGEGKISNESTSSAGLRKWFNLALFVHTIIPALLVAVGYPLGIYAINHWLKIPSDRVVACIWVFRLALVSAFVSMVSVPFTAMFHAYQLITELSIVSIVQTLLNFTCAYLLMSVEYDHLVAYAFYMMALSLLFGLIQIVWACCRFKACRVRVADMFDRQRFREFFSFAGAKIFGSTCVVCRTQGGCMLLNQFFQPFVNAAYTISIQVSGHTSALAQSLVGALQPAIVTKAGANDLHGMLRYSVSACRIASLLVLLFVIPLSVEIDEVLRLWLDNPPVYAAGYCICMLVMLVLDKMSVGYMLAANAYGKKIVIYELVLGLILLLSLPFSYIAFKMGLSPNWLAICLTATMALNSFARVAFCRWQLHMSIREWVNKIVAPVAFLAVLGYLTSSIPKSFMEPSFLRIALASFISLVVVPLFGWFMVLASEERGFAIRAFNRMAERILK